MRDLIATRNFTYNTRRLMAGDSFTASPQWARALIAAGRAQAKPAEAEPVGARQPEPVGARQPEPPGAPVGALTAADLPPPIKRGRGRPRKHPKPG